LDRERGFMVVTGLVVGILAAVLVVLGNPGNMGFCIACFLRDTTGALGFQRAGVVQYLRPEILGLVLGAFIAAFKAKEFKSRGGSSTLVRFFLGMFMMIGALVFLGCPLRDILRIGGGDLNAVVGLAGFIGGVLLGVFFLRKGFDLGAARTDKGSQVGGYFLVAIAVVLLIMLVSGINFNPEAGGPLFFSKEGPGSMRAPLWISLGAGVIVGYLAQKARLCLSGGFRDYFLIREKSMLLAYLGIFVGVLALNLYFGKFHLGFADQPIAHTNHIFNFLGLFLVGLSAVLLGGCPLRQIVLGSEGDTDATTAVLGMVAGAAIAHNFLLAAGPGGTTPFGEVAVIVGIIVVSFIGWAYREAGA